jgi:hypothetical protein
MIREDCRMWTAFEYMYRDAGNFKAFGTVTLEGAISTRDQRLICCCLADGEFFIAEQVGVPPLYEHLYEWSGGPTQSDHCWHEFVGFRELAILEDPTCTTRADEFVSRFVNLQTWDESLSPHFSLADSLCSAT